MEAASPGLVPPGASLAGAFPDNPFVRRLVDFALARGIRFEASPYPEQWLYHPGRRAILVWPPDLRQQTLTFLVLILAHELGHARDFDRRPYLSQLLRRRPDPRLQHAVERSAFVGGFELLKQLQVPVSLSQYVAGILPPMDQEVHRVLSRRLCCLLDRRASGDGAATAAEPGAPVPAHPAPRPPTPAGPPAAA